MRDTYSGFGYSKSDAKNDAWDHVYLGNSDASYSTDSKTSSDSEETDFGAVAAIIFGPVGFWLFGRVIGYFLGFLYALGHNINEIGKNATTFSVYCGYILLVPGLISSVILFIDLYKGRT